MEAQIPTTFARQAPGSVWTWTRFGVAIVCVVATVVVIVQATDVTVIFGAGTRLLQTPTLLIAFLVAYASAFYLRALAWTLLAPTLGRWDAFVILHASLFANHAAPVKIGEVLRPFLAAKCGLTITDAVTSSVAARLLDVIILVAIVGTLVPLGPALATVSTPVFLVLPLIVGTAMVVTLVWLRLGGTLAWGAGRLIGVIEAFNRSLRNQPISRLLGAAALTLPSWVLEGTVVYIAAFSLGITISPEAAVAATAFTLMFQIVHVSPGGIGLYEASMTGALVVFGLSPVDAVSVAVLAHGLKFFYSFTIGLGLAASVAHATGWRGVGLSPRGLVLFGLFAIQLLLVVGYLYRYWSAPTVLVLDVLLIFVVGVMILGRQWYGAWRPLPPEMPTGDNQRPIVLVIPAFNEAQVLPSTIDRIPRDIVDRIIVVDDGSVDSTSDAARRSGADLVVRHDRNRGLGAALRTALESAKTFDPKAVVYVDADGEYDPGESAVLLSPILSGEADYVLGSRTLGTRAGQSLSRKLGNFVFTALLGLVAGRRITDGQTGFRAFSSRALGTAEIVHDYNYAQVLTLNLLRKRMRIREVPITWSRRTVGASFIRLEYLWRVPLGMLRELLKA